MASEPPRPLVEPAALRDRRTAPTGVLPRHLQAWLMVGTALVIALIILVTGHPQPVPAPTAQKVDEAAPVRPGAVQHFAQELAKNQLPGAESHPNALGTHPTESQPLGPTLRSSGAPVALVRTSDQSLLADNVVLSRRQASDQPSPSAQPAVNPKNVEPTRGASAPPAALAQLEQNLTQLAAAAGRAGPVPAAPESASNRSEEPRKTEPSTPSNGIHQGPTALVEERKSQENPAGGPRLRLLEGSVIETVLVTRLNGTFAGPVTCQVTTPVFSADRQYVLIPAGARLLGSSAPVQSWGDSRLAVSFHRLLMPDGHTYSLETFRGLDQVGEAGVTESVNRHYLEVFGASIAIGALSGLAQFGTTGGLGVTSFSDEYRQAAGSSLAASSSRVLDRYLNVLPTITIREGYRIKVYLTRDFDLPAYASASDAGGAR